MLVVMVAAAMQALAGCASGDAEAPETPSAVAGESTAPDLSGRKIKVFDDEYRGFSFVVELDGQPIGQTPLDAPGSWVRSLSLGAHTLTIQARSGVTRRTQVGVHLWSGKNAPIYFLETSGVERCQFDYMNDGGEELVQMGKQAAICRIDANGYVELRFMVSDRHPGLM
jgi:hypothetical protein